MERLLFVGLLLSVAMNAQGFSESFDESNVVSQESSWDHSDEWDDSGRDSEWDRPEREDRPGREDRVERGDRWDREDRAERGDRWDDEEESAFIRCSSYDYGRKTCATRRPIAYVRLIRQSGASCVYGSSWGVNYRSVWVDRDCRAIFEVKYR